MRKSTSQLHSEAVGEVARCANKFGSKFGYVRKANQIWRNLPELSHWIAFVQEMEARENKLSIKIVIGIHSKVIDIAMGVGRFVQKYTECHWIGDYRLLTQTDGPERWTATNGEEFDDALASIKSILNEHVFPALNRIEDSGMLFIAASRSQPWLRCSPEYKRRYLTILERFADEGCIEKEPPKYICPVCGYDQLEEPPRSSAGGASYEICSCCFFEFGYDDDAQGWTYEAWRAKWLSEGMPWRNQHESPPKDWNPHEQIRRVL